MGLLRSEVTSIRSKAFLLEKVDLLLGSWKEIFYDNPAESDVTGRRGGATNISEDIMECRRGFTQDLI